MVENYLKLLVTLSCMFPCFSEFHICGIWSAKFFSGTQFYSQVSRTTQIPNQIVVVPQIPNTQIVNLQLSSNIINPINWQPRPETPAVTIKTPLKCNCPPKSPLRVQNKRLLDKGFKQYNFPPGSPDEESNCCDKLNETLSPDKRLPVAQFPAENLRTPPDGLSDKSMPCETKKRNKIYINQWTWIGCSPPIKKR